MESNFFLPFSSSRMLEEIFNFAFSCAYWSINMRNCNHSLHGCNIVYDGNYMQFVEKWNGLLVITCTLRCMRLLLFSTKKKQLFLSATDEGNQQLIVEELLRAYYRSLWCKCRNVLNERKSITVIIIVSYKQANHKVTNI